MSRSSQLLAVVPALLAAVLAGGCQTPARSGVAYLAEPLTPLSTLTETSPASYADLGQNCPGSHVENAPRSAISDLVLIYDTSGREFREPAGPDGFVVRVIPLGRASVPLDNPADFIIAVFAGEPDQVQTSAPPVRTWRVPAPAAARYWADFQPLAGYVFRLDWGPVPLPVGRYFLFVRLEQNDRVRTPPLCSQIAFEDNAPRGGADQADPAETDQAPTQRKVAP